MIVEPKRCKFKKSTRNYQKDNVLDIIDIEETLSKNRYIPKAPLNNFIYSKDIELLNNKNKIKNTKRSIYSYNEEEIDYPKLNNNKFGINFNNLMLDYSNGFSIKFTKLYFPIEILGEGAFGLVISVINLNTKEKLAVKIRNKEGTDEKSLNQTLALLNKLDSPNILKIYEVIDTSKYYFIFMEYIEGNSLKDLIIERYMNENNNYLFQDIECSIIMKNLLESIDYLHKHNVIHRDIKPENVMFKEKNNLSSIVLCDFGLAYKRCNFDNLVNEKCGTLIYMAPEIIEGRKYDHLVDSYSAGIILYVLSSGGIHPFYQRGIKRDKYEQIVLNNDTVIFPHYFPLLARNLFFKLCKFQAYYRYEIYKALAHPWITRDSKSIIPFTLTDRYKLQIKVKNFKSLLSCTMIFSAIKSIYHFTKNIKKVENPTLRISQVKLFLTKISPIRKPISINKNLNFKTENSSHEEKKLINNLSNKNKLKIKSINLPKINTDILNIKQRNEFSDKHKNKLIWYSPISSNTETNYLSFSSNAYKIKEKTISQRIDLKNKLLSNNEDNFNKIISIENNIILKNYNNLNKNIKSNLLSNNLLNLSVNTYNKPTKFLFKRNNKDEMKNNISLLNKTNIHYNKYINDNYNNSTECIDNKLMIQSNNNDNYYLNKPSFNISKKYSLKSNSNLLKNLQVKSPDNIKLKIFRKCISQKN